MNAAIAQINDKIAESGKDIKDLNLAEIANDLNLSETDLRLWALSSGYDCVWAGTENGLNYCKVAA